MELKQIWEEALKIIEEETSPVSFETWIQRIIPCGMEGNQVILQVENAFFWPSSVINSLLRAV